MASWINRLFQSSSALLGLDLADAGLRLVELRQQACGLVVTGASAQPLPPGCVVDGDIEQFDALVLALRQLLQRQPVSTRALAMALPTTAIRLETWQAPNGLDEQRLDDWVRSEAAQRWQTAEQPLSLDCAYWSEPTPACPAEGAPGLAPVWVAGAPLELVQDRQGLAQACGLQLTVLEDASAAASRAWRRVQSEQVSPNGSLDSSGPPANGMDIFSGLQKGRRLAEWPPAEPGTFATACGLALRRFMP